MWCNVFTPQYAIKEYRPNYHKVIRFKCPLMLRVPSVRGEDKVHEEKLSQSLSRARSVIRQVVICNDWDFFFTCTLDKRKHDRYSLKAFQVDFPQWVRDYRKKYNCKIEYAIVPEQHKDGAWHIHGVLRGIPADHLSNFIPGIHPKRLTDNGFKNWGLCSEKFGYCSLDPVKDPVAVGHYLSKYITKELADSAIGHGMHLYYCSIGLKREQPCGYVYDWNMFLDMCCVSDSPFCATGFTDQLDWVLISQLVGTDGFLKFDDFYPEDVSDETLLSDFGIQMSFDDFEDISRGGCSW